MSTFPVTLPQREKSQQPRRPGSTNEEKCFECQMTVYIKYFERKAGEDTQIFHPNINRKTLKRAVLH